MKINTVNYLLKNKKTPPKEGESVYNQLSLFGEEDLFSGEKEE
jgi:hypothetical protein